MEVLQPLAILDVGFAPRHPFDMAGVDQTNFQTPALQDLEGDPVDPCGFDRDCFDCTGYEPVGQGVQLLGKGGEFPHRAIVSLLGHRHIDLGGSNIDASGIGLNEWHTLLLFVFLLPFRVIAFLPVKFIAPCERAARMVDKKKIGNLLIGMRLALSPAPHQCLAHRIRNHAPFPRKSVAWHTLDAPPSFARRHASPGTSGAFD